MRESRTCTLIAAGLSISFADQPILVNVDVTITDASRVAVTGPNGVGKSTLLRVLTGDLTPDTGTITRHPSDLTVGLVVQEPVRDQESARAHIAGAVGVREATAELEGATEALAAGANGADDRYDRALDAWIRSGAADFDARLATAAHEVGLEPHLLDLPTDALSGGQASRVGLAAVLVSRFDVTLLDEPTNNLDGEGIAVLDQWIARHRGGLVMVSHDRAFLERTARGVLELDDHTHEATLFEGGWRAYLDEKATARAHAHQRYATYSDERDRLRARSQRQREWADQGVSRAKKHPADGDKFRRRWAIDQTEKLAGRARATDKALERLEVVDKPWEGWDLRFTVAEAPRSATVVAVLEGAMVRRGTFEVGPVDEEIRWGERVRLAGPNGSGKTTLIDTLLGRRAPDQGRVRLGSGVVVGELGQRRDDVDGAGVESLLEVVMRETDLDVTEARSVLAKFGLDADAVSRRAGSLSPGERTRAQLALFQAQGVNLLVLDEPTNHLDLPAIDQLESALDSFGGTLILVSHDVRLLEAVRIDRTIELPSPPGPG